MSQVASRAAAPVSPVSPAAAPPAVHVPTRAPSYSLARGAVACAGVFIVIGVMAFASFNLGWLLLLGSFGSTAVMVFTFPELHFSQPRSVIGGHVICTAVGLAALALFGPAWWALAAATAAAVALMMLTRTLHPPAGSNPVIVFLVAPQWGFLVFPTLLGALAMVAVAVLFHRGCRRQYPVYWY
jgi:CBS-domain-containing membrane protein